VSLTAADIAEILRLVEDSSFDELSLELEGLKLNFKRGESGRSGEGAPGGESTAHGEGRTQQPAIAAPAAAASAKDTAAIAAGAAAGASAAGAAAAADPNSTDVISPMLGTFYRAPKPGAPPFVAVGSAVEEDTIVGIIEVMKLMNTVRAQVRGTVTEVRAADGALVEYGETLLRVRKAV